MNILVQKNSILCTISEKSKNEPRSQYKGIKEGLSRSIYSANVLNNFVINDEKEDYNKDNFRSKFKIFFGHKNLQATQVEDYNMHRAFLMAFTCLLGMKEIQ